MIQECYKCGTSFKALTHTDCPECKSEDTHEVIDEHEFEEDESCGSEEE